MDMEKEYSWPELGAKTKEEYESRKQELLAFVQRKRIALDAVSSVDEFYEFCVECTKEWEFGRPVNLTLKDFAPAAEDLAFLERQGYPGEFIDWHRKYGNAFVWLEAIRLNTLPDVMREVNSSFYELLPRNGFLILTTDPGGNGILFDQRAPEAKFYFADHDTVYGSRDSLEEFYSEMLDFWVEDGGEYHNPEELEVGLILDEEGNFRADSPYYRLYLEEELEELEGASFLEMVKGQSRLGMEYILGRYNIVS